jgi:type IV pilus assembly protein PilC
MKFRVAIEKDGKVENRVVDAPTRFAVYELVEKEGGAVRRLEEGVGGGLNIQIPSLASLGIGSGVSSTDVITFTKNLAAMLGAGLPLSRALAVMERQARKAGLKKVIADLGEAVKKGSAFHDALLAHPKVFSTLMSSMAKAGEESGTLAASLLTVSEQMERTQMLIKKVRGAMIYPAIVIFAMIVIGVLMLIYVVPTLASTFKDLGADLPVSTQIILGASDFLVNNLLLVLVGALIVGVGIWFLVRVKAVSSLLFSIVLRIPVVGTIVAQTYTARAARTLSSLLASGVEVLTALAIAKDVVGAHGFGRVIGEAAVRVQKGEPLSAAFVDHPEFYPPLMADMLAVGEETGHVAEMLKQVAVFYEAEVEQSTKDLSTIIEPVLMLLIGLMVGVFAVSVISPIYSISSKI